jgi:hypothetical protein
MLICSLDPIFTEQDLLWILEAQSPQFLAIVDNLIDSVTKLACQPGNCGDGHFNKPFVRSSSETYREFKPGNLMGGYTCPSYDTKCSFSIVIPYFQIQS